MDDNIDRRLPFGLDKDKLAPPTSKTTDINEVKKNVSKVIKSPFQKQKEEAEKKKKVIRQGHVVKKIAKIARLARIHIS
jgi:hypothetical protein